MTSRTVVAELHGCVSGGQYSSSRMTFAATLSNDLHDHASEAQDILLATRASSARQEDHANATRHMEGLWVSLKDHTEPRQLPGLSQDLHWGPWEGSRVLALATWQSKPHARARPCMERIPRTRAESLARMPNPLLFAPGKVGKLSILLLIVSSWNNSGPVHITWLLQNMSQKGTSVQIPPIQNDGLCAFSLPV